VTAPLDFGLVAFTSLLAMLNPLEAAPLFVSMTRGHEETRRLMAVRAALTAGAAMLLFALAGGGILGFFGVTVPAFQIAGGLLFLGAGVRQLQGGHDETVPVAAGDPSVVPLGVPTLAGAGTLSTVMVLAGQARTPLHKGALAVAIGANVAVALGALVLAPALVSRLGRTGAEAMSRVMGLVAAVIGVQFVIDGVSAVVHRL
jgi:multiple antibiotic resistance protein